MPIVAFYDGDVQGYLREKWQPATPEACPLCGARSTLVGHGSYSRYVAEAEPTLRLRVPRYRCRACGHTVGVLPSFLVPRRHYSASYIQLVLALRHQVGLSRRGLMERLGRLPALSTCMAWLRAFEAGARLWLDALLSALSRASPGDDLLKGLVSPMGLAHGPPRLLLELLPDLLSALGMGGAGLSRGLGRLLLWGQGHRLPRLL